MRKRVLYAKSPEWREVAVRGDSLMAGRGFREVKRNERTCAGFLDVGEDLRAFVKCVATLSWVRGIFARFGGSRAWRSLRGATILEAGGFAHPELLAASETLSYGAVRRSFVLTEPLKDALMMSVFALGERGRRNRDFSRCKRVSETVAREIRRMHDCGIYTRDLQETNLMLEANDGALTVYFVDLEDFRRVRKVSRRRRILNLVHLDRSIGRFVPRTQRLRFLYNYLGGKPGRPESRRIVREVLAIRGEVERRHESAHGADKPSSHVSAMTGVAETAKKELLSGGRG